MRGRAAQGMALEIASTWLRRSVTACVVSIALLASVPAVAQLVPPVITSNGGGSTATIPFSENQTAVTTVTAMNGPITFSLTGGADQARFSIGATSGVLTFLAPPDFENPTDTPPVNSYNVTVRATNLVGFDEQAITVNVTNVPETPVITSNGGGPNAAISVPENQATAVTTVVATNGPITFSLTAGADQARFSIGGASGVLTFLTPPDFENPTDAGLNNTYVVTVTATGPDGADNQSIIVTVTNVGDAPPVITSNGGGDTAAISVAENQTAVTTVTATNPETGTLTFSLTGGADQARFSIGGGTGVLTFLTPPDFENPTDTPPVNSYNVIVRATNVVGFDEQTITVNVTNVAETPVITSNGGGPSAAISVPENQATPVTTVVATNGPITFSLSAGADQARFSIGGASGVLTFVAPPDFENPTDTPPVNSYNVTVRATGPDGFDEQAITVNVTNLTDAPPAISSNGGGDTAAISVAENQTAVTTVTATNSETGAVTFSLTGGADQARFSIVGGTGVLTFVAAPNFESPTDADTNNTYIVIVTATAVGGTDTQTITVTVTNANDPPVATADSYAGNEDAVLTTPAPGVLANDTDPDATTTLTAQLVTNVAPAAGTVTLNANGSFTYTPAANFNGVATFTYHAADNGTPPIQSATPATATITVTPVNDAPVAVPNTYTTNEDTPLNVPLPQGILANDTDVDVGSLLTAQLATNVAPASGTLTLNLDGSFNYAPAQDFTGVTTFTYMARDNGAPPLQSTPATVTINVPSVNDAPRPVNPPPAPAVPDQTANENTPIVPLALAALFRDPEGSPMLFTVTGLPPGLTATPDGTVSGRPTLGISVGEFNVSVVVSDGTDAASPPPFKFTVLRADRTDLSLAISAAPSPATINQPVSWTFTIANRSPAVGVGNVSLRAVLSGQVPLAVSPSTGCTVTPQGNQTEVICTRSTVPPAGSTTVVISGSSTQPGDVLTSANVSITDPVPVDDIAANNAATGVLNIAQSLASGPGQTLPAAGYAASAAGDLNGDGFVDLVVASALQGTLIYPNIVDASGNKRVLAEQPLSLGDSGSGGGIALMDLDGDNALDIIVAKRDGGSRILRNLRTSPGSFDFAPLPALLGLPTDVSNAVAAGDLNGDGRPEIVLANSSPNLVFVNQGGGLFAQSAALGNDDSRDVVIANLYGDASPELVFANADANATLYSFNAATSGFDAASLVTGPTTSVAAGDFDRDGRTDLVFGRSGPAAGALSTLLLLNTTVSGGPGQFFLAAELGASPTSDVLAVDTDVDADLDIVAISLPGGHKIFSNNGSGQFMVRAEQFATASALGATAGKLSTDDRVDVAVTGAPGIAVFYNDGRGNLGAGDTGAPIIQLVGQPTVNLTVEDPYTDAGATATDAVDGNLTARIRVTNPVNTAVIGTYTVTYNVVDSSGNAATPVTRTVNVSVRSGTGGGGGGVFDLGVALLLALLVMARARSKLDVTRAPARAGSVRRS